MLTNLFVNVFTISNPKNVPLGLVGSHGGDKHSCLHIYHIDSAVFSCAEDMATVCNTE